MFRMFYIEIETKNVFPSFDVSKVHLKPCSYARGLFCNVDIILFCVYIAKNKKDIYFIKILIVFDFVVCYTKSPFKTLIFKVIQRQLNIFKELKPRFVSPQNLVPYL